MSSFANPIVGSGDVLVRDAIQSEDYVAGVSGWRIARNGDAEFNNVTVRARLLVDGTDGSYVWVLTRGGHADIVLQPKDVAGELWNPSVISTGIAANGQPQLTLTGPYGSGVTQPPPQITLQGPTTTQDFGSIFFDAAFWTFFSSGQAGAMDITGDLSVVGNFTVQTGIGEVQTAIQAADQTNNTTTLADTDLFFNVVAGGTYEYKVRGAYDAPVATDIKFAWTTPATTIADKLVAAPDLGTATNIATSMVQIRRAMTTAQAVGAPNGVANGFTSYREDGLIEASAAGACTLQMAANAAGTATWRANSYLIVTRIA